MQLDQQLHLHGDNIIKQLSNQSILSFQFLLNRFNLILSKKC